MDRVMHLSFINRIISTDLSLVSMDTQGCLMKSRRVILSGYCNRKILLNRSMSCEENWSDKFDHSDQNEPFVIGGPTIQDENECVNELVYVHQQTLLHMFLFSQIAVQF